MTGASLIRATIIHTIGVAGHFWPRLVFFILVYLFLAPLLVLAYWFVILGSIPVMLTAFAALTSFLLFYLANLLAWSWILSGWIRHELVPDGMPHPLPAGKHTRALYWQQFFSTIIAGLIFIIAGIPFIVVSVIVFKALTAIITAFNFDVLGIHNVMHITSYIILICMSAFPFFLGAIFYLRYSVGALSLTLYGQKMSLSDASAYSTEHEPAGLTRRYATYIKCFFFVISFIGVELDYVAQSLSTNEEAYSIIALLVTLLLFLIFTIVIMALITSYLKNMPTAALNPQKSRS